MPSPFPGMNPYFEQRPVWRGFHTSYLVTLRRALVAALAPRYRVELEESLYLDYGGDQGGFFAVADAAVGGHTPDGGSAAEPATDDAPVTTTVNLRITRRRLKRRVVILDAAGPAVVCVIELLSPSEKRAGKDRERYLAKRARVFASDTHLIEIDLLRGGQRMPAADMPSCSYCVLVSRAGLRPRVGLWPLGLRDRLPAIRVPLVGNDPEPSLDLQTALDQVHDDDGYRHTIYDGRPSPPLIPADAAWAAALITPLVPARGRTPPPR